METILPFVIYSSISLSILCILFSLLAWRKEWQFHPSIAGAVLTIPHVIGVMFYCMIQSFPSLDIVSYTFSSFVMLPLFTSLCYFWEQQNKWRQRERRKEVKRN